MWEGFPLFPERASTHAGKLDALYLFMVGVSVFFVVLIFTLLIFFAVKYRRRPGRKAHVHPVTGNIPLELLWTLVPLGLTMVIFGWGTKLYLDLSRPPADAMDIYVVGKQWMWKIWHVGGQSEINELHLPVGRAVKLHLVSEDVIHSFYVPAFRVKRDVLPGRVHYTWFEPTRVGEYHLFCAEYCGTNHSQMVGKVVVMEPKDYARWLSGAGAEETMASAGEQLFDRWGCKSCHTPGPESRCPPLGGLYGGTVALRGGGTVVADDGYLREAILDPGATVVAGYKPSTMPTYQGKLTEEEVIQLIEYIKSLSGEGEREG